MTSTPELPCPHLQLNTILTSTIADSFARAGLGQGWAYVCKGAPGLQVWGETGEGEERPEEQQGRI